jgi:hypothetical protein
MTAGAPLGGIVRTEPRSSVEKPPSHVEHAEAPEAGWQASSYALLSGCQVKDYTERIPDQVFDALFKDWSLPTSSRPKRRRQFATSASDASLIAGAATSSESRLPRQDT